MRTWFLKTGEQKNKRDCLRGVRQENRRTWGLLARGKTGEHENMGIACGDKTGEHEKMGIACEDKTEEQKNMFFG